MAKTAEQRSPGETHSQEETDLPVTIYTPESPLRRPFLLLTAMMQDLVVSRELAWRLFLRDTRARYRNSLLGYAWVFIPPLLAALPFIFLNSQGVVRFGDTPIPFGAFAMLGTMIWQVFVDALNSPLVSLSGARLMLNRVKLSPEAILLSGLMQVGLNFLVRLLLVAVVLILYGIIPPSTAILFPLGIMALALTGFALGLIVAPLGLLYGDVQKALGIVTPVIMFLTPVLYPPPTSGLAGIVVALNPLTPLVVTTRDWLTLGTTSHLAGFIFVTALMVACLIMGWVVLRVSLPHLIVRFGN